jgi:hypothetical protein
LSLPSYNPCSFLIFANKWSSPFIVFSLSMVRVPSFSRFPV